MSTSCSFCYRPMEATNPIHQISLLPSRKVKLLMPKRIGTGIVRASAVESSYGSSSDFAHRMERAWLISQQPRPVACSSCDSKGHLECKWCSGTGFFILGDNMLCQFPSRNTTCVICAGKGSACCSNCKGTGYRAKWLGKPPITK